MTELITPKFKVFVDGNEFAATKIIFDKELTALQLELEGECGMTVLLKEVETLTIEH